MQLNHILSGTLLSWTLRMSLLLSLSAVVPLLRSFVSYPSHDDKNSFGVPVSACACLLLANREGMGYNRDSRSSFLTRGNLKRAGELAHVACTVARPCTALRALVPGILAGKRFQFRTGSWGFRGSGLRTFTSPGSYENSSWVRGQVSHQSLRVGNLREEHGWCLQELN